MFDVTAWLEENNYGYKCLSDNERQAITGFSLLWGLFEAQMLGREAQARGQSVNARRIVKKCKTLCKPIGSVQEDHFSSSLAHFRERYTKKDGVVNSQFEYLHFRPSDRRGLVKKVLLDHESTTTAEKLAACLIIVFRYRNNDFHGIKWATEFRDQQENFEESNKLLAYVLDLLKDG